MKLTRFEKTVLIWCLALLVLGVATLLESTAHAAPLKKPKPLGPFMLVLRFSHHASKHLTWIPNADEEDMRFYIDVVDAVETVGPFSGWDTCDGAALEAEGRLADQPHNSYVAASCLFLGRR